MNQVKETNLHLNTSIEAPGFEGTHVPAFVSCTGIVAPLLSIPSQKGGRFKGRINAEVIIDDGAIQRAFKVLEYPAGKNRGLRFVVFGAVDGVNGRTDLKATSVIEEHLEKKHWHEPKGLPKLEALPNYPEKRLTWAYKWDGLSQNWIPVLKANHEGSGEQCNGISYINPFDYPEAKGKLVPGVVLGELILSISWNISKKKKEDAEPVKTVYVEGPMSWSSNSPYVAKKGKMEQVGKTWESSVWGFPRREKPIQLPAPEKTESQSSKPTANNDSDSGWFSNLLDDAIAGQGEVTSEANASTE